MIRHLLFALSLVTVASAADDKENAPEEEKPSKQDVPRAGELAKKVKPALVSIEPAGRDGEIAGVGTGFVIAEDGLIATNMHVIGDARPLKISLPDGTKLEVTAIHAWNREKDLAILRVGAQGLTALELGDSSQLAQGDYVAAMGNPLGLRFSVVEGVVSAMQELDGNTLVQVAMPVERGNSGGPLLDKDGRVIGIVSMKSALTDNLGFAVPVDELKALMEKPAPVAMKSWLTIGALSEKTWKTTGALWSQRAGVIRARSQDYTSFGRRALCIHQTEPPALPYEITVRVKLDDESGAAGLIFCSDGADTHYGFYPSSGGLRLTRFEGPDVSSWNILAQTRHAAYKPGEWNHLRVRLEAERIQCFVNGELVITSEDKALRTGRAGLAKFRHTEPDFKGFRVSRETAGADPVADAIAALTNSAARGESLSPEALETLAAYPDTTIQVMEREAATLEKRAATLRVMAAEAHEQSVAQQLKDLLTKKEPADSDLARAAFLIARLDNAEFDPADGMAELDRMTEELQASLTDEDKKSAEQKLAALHRWMFVENGFHGGVEDMNHRANSYLNEVIADREGLPITLCVLHREFARRIGLKVSLRGFPGRVMNHLQLPGEPPRDVYIDAFERGKILSDKETAAHLLDLIGEVPDEESWKPVTDTAVILRMLNNLTANASSAGDDARALRYLNTALTLDPPAATHRLQRMLIHAKAGRKEKARADAAYLIAQEPPGIDTSRVFELMESLK
jgi:serine protease Do